MESLYKQVSSRLFGPGSPLEQRVERIRWEDGLAAHHAGVDNVVYPKMPQDLVQWYGMANLRGFGEREFLLMDTTRITYKETAQRAAALGNELVARGISRGDRVTICMKNCPEYIVAFIAITSIGAVAVPMNSWWTTHELEYGLQNSGTKIFVCDADRLERVKPILGRTDVKVTHVFIVHDSQPTHKVNGVTVENFDSLVAASKGKSMPPFPCGKDENAVLMYTSGTTGFPKGVVLTHRGITHALNSGIANGALEKAVAAIRAGKTPGMPEEEKQQAVTLLAVPLFHATGLHAVFLLSFVIGRKIVFMNKWDPEVALQLIQRERVTNFTGVPTMVLSMLEHPNLAKYDVSSMQGIGGGGAPPPPSMVKDIGNKFKKASPNQGYGMTECNAVVCLNDGANYVSKPTSCGRPVPGVTVEIWELESEKPLPRNVPGRVMIKGASLMKEYWRNPEATSKTITASGFLDSGDIGRMDDDGFVYIMDRAKDMIIRGGENISCAEIEAAVYENPAISEAAVVPVPHPTLQEEVGVAVFLRPGKTLTLGELRKSTRALAGFKQPAHLFIYSEQLPRGATGKILKTKIKEDIKNGLLRKDSIIPSKL